MLFVSRLSSVVVLPTITTRRRWDITNPFTAVITIWNMPNLNNIRANDRGLGTTCI